MYNAGGGDWRQTSLNDVWRREGAITHSVLGYIMLILDDVDHVKTRQNGGHEVNVLDKRNRFTITTE